MLPLLLLLLLQQQDSLLQLLQILLLRRRGRRRRPGARTSVILTYCQDILLSPLQVPVFLVQQLQESLL